MDLELILVEFIANCGEIKSTNAGGNIMVEITKIIRKFVSKYEPKPDLLTQYQQAIETEQYELADIIKNEILQIIKK